jgi:hypothetical protein
MKRVRVHLHFQGESWLKVLSPTVLNSKELSEYYIQIVERVI